MSKDKSKDQVAAIATASTDPPQAATLPPVADAPRPRVGMLGYIWLVAPDNRRELQAYPALVLEKARTKENAWQCRIFKLAHTAANLNMTEIPFSASGPKVRHLTADLPPGCENGRIQDPDYKPEDATIKMPPAAELAAAATAVASGSPQSPGSPQANDSLCAVG